MEREHSAPRARCPYCQVELPDYASEGWWRHLIDHHPEHVKERPSTLRKAKPKTYMDNPPACGANPKWPWGFLPCGCHNDGYGNHVR